jgi:hypothetical protein
MMELTIAEDTVRQAVTASIEKLVLSQGHRLIEDILRDILAEGRRSPSAVQAALKRMVDAEIERQLAEYLEANENTIREHVIAALSGILTAEHIARNVADSLSRVKFTVPLGEKKLPIDGTEEEDD